MKQKAPLACGHKYCFQCISESCRHSIQNIEFFPARCSTCDAPVTDEMVTIFLEGPDLTRYERLWIEKDLEGNFSLFQIILILFIYNLSSPVLFHQSLRHL